MAVLANADIFLNFESASDISEETHRAHREVPRAMRGAVLYGAIASVILLLGLPLATPTAGIKGVVSGGIPVLFAGLSSVVADFFSVMEVIAFFNCGTAVQGARVAFALARDGVVPGFTWLQQVSPRFKTPANAVLVGVIIPFLFMLLVLANPSKPVRLSTRRTPTPCTHWSPSGCRGSTGRSS